MKKHISLILFGTILALSASALDINVSPGALENALKNTDLNSVSELTLNGNIDARDLQTLSSLPAGVTSLNLASTDIDKIVLRDKKLFNHSLLEANVIPDYCFFRSNIKNIKLPLSTTSIGAGSFAGSAIDKISIPEGVETIGEYAFYDCPELEEITIPSTVVSIGKGAFANCPKLRYVNIRTRKITEIPDECFRGDSSLEEMIVPASVATIGKEAFRGTAIEELSIPNVAELAPYSLSGMRMLRSLQLSQNVKIGTGALMDDENLTEISGNPKNIPDYYAANCVSLDPTENLVSASTIGNYAFANNYGSNLTLGNNVTSLGKGVFAKMGALSSIDAISLKGNIPEVEEGSFDGINPSSIKLYVDKDNYDDWKNHPQWGEFDVQSENNVGLESLTADNSAISILLSGNILVISAPETISEAAIYSVDGEILTKGAGQTEMQFLLDEISEKVIIVKVSAPSGKRSEKFMIR